MRIDGIKGINRVARRPGYGSRINHLRAPSAATARANRDSRRYDADTLDDISRTSIRPTTQGA